MLVCLLGLFCFVAVLLFPVGNALLKFQLCVFSDCFAFFFSRPSLCTCCCCFFLFCCFVPFEFDFVLVVSVCVFVVCLVCCRNFVRWCMRSVFTFTFDHFYSPLLFIHCLQLSCPAQPHMLFSPSLQSTPFEYLIVFLFC